MKRSGLFIAAVCGLILAVALCAGCTDTSSSAAAPSGDAGASDATMTITDGMGRTVTVPVSPDRVVCSGPGCLRYLTYLQAEDHVVGVDDIEIKENIFDARPYAIANPQFSSMPMIGEFRGNDDPEKVVACNPDVIFKTYCTEASEADELQEKTGIPVVALQYGDLGNNRALMDESLRLMGTVMGNDDRAEAVIAYFDTLTADLKSRTEGIAEEDQPTVFIGGVAHAGPHGFQSTQPTYPPFIFVNARMLSDGPQTSYADIAQEKIIAFDPDVIFVDLSTLQTTPSAIDELKDDPSYAAMTAVQADEVYGVLPYNWYTANQGSVMADAYFIGTVLYPEEFSDVDPAEKADEIYTFLVGEPVFDEMDSLFDNQAFKRISLE
ncbi:iron ABC transporter substrate-binding protein [Methanogenium organophilum]|uniref:Iron ABC transporter substrate-binding protein n=1 Tax=Methanogenium organophilum TaxID=2199 RepID=A0A9X9S260_METOG|nr:iron ABC transporter substrate-binding protein [Methanogenium organophilum]WAI00437.1 iron ABC transporter substrate-binding protein [Methanogenium organophilum]